MKTFIRFLVLICICAGLAACHTTNASNKKQADANKQYQRKIYLTEDDYLEDLDKTAFTERRQAKPNTESQYVFEKLPETEKNVYFFDERVRPMVPGQPSERDYKKTKRLWEKPKRYSPEQYYGNQAAAQTATREQEQASSSSSGYEEDNDFDY